MGIFSEDEHTLVRLVRPSGLYVKVLRHGETKAEISTSDPKGMLNALAVAWQMHKSGSCGIRSIDKTVVGLGLSGFEHVATVRSQRGAVLGMVVAEFIPLACRVMKHDPTSTYEPVRRLVVSAGGVMLRHHKQETAASGIRREVAFRRIVKHASEAVLVRLLTEGSINE